MTPIAPWEHVVLYKSEGVHNTGAKEVKR